MFQEVDRITSEVMENLRYLSHAPGVQMPSFPPQSMLPTYDIDPKRSEERLNKYLRQHMIIRDEAEEDMCGGW